MLMAWAIEHDHVVLANDLDFTALLASSGAAGPSVIQLRAQNLLPEAVGKIVVHVLNEHEVAFEQGAFVTVDEAKARVRILPLLRKRATEEGSG